MYSAIIVDDEIFQQETLKRMLEAYCPQYNILAICSSVDEGIEKIMTLKPQLVLLDVMMPPKTGFDLLNEIPERIFEVIFTTSFDSFAVKAFKVSAVDYLLKPFTTDELLRGLKKFEEKVAEQSAFNHIELLLRNIYSSKKDLKIALPTLSGFAFVAAMDIVRCESDNSYTTFHFKDKKKMTVSRSMKECEEMLDEDQFFRVHTSHIVNLNCIKEYVRGEGGVVVLEDGSHVDVSRRRKDEFLRKLKMP